ncbi:hypothetical protein ACF0H5_005019 [Mactra antiquata]
MRLFTLGLVAVWSVVLIICIPNFVHGTVGPFGYGSYHYPVKKIGIIPPHVHPVTPYGPFGELFQLIIFIVIFTLIIKLLTNTVEPMMKDNYDKGGYKSKKKDYNHDYGYNEY